MTSEVLDKHLAWHRCLNILQSDVELKVSLTCWSFLHSSFLILFLLSSLFHCMLQVFPAVFITHYLGVKCYRNQDPECRSKNSLKSPRKALQGEWWVQVNFDLTRLARLARHQASLFTPERRKGIPWMTNTDHVPSYDMTKSTLDRSSWSSLWIRRASTHLSLLCISIHDVPSLWLEKGMATQSSILA